MTHPDTIRGVLVSVVLSLTMLTACSTQGPRDTQEQQESAETPTRSATTKETMETAGAATMVVILLGVGLAVAALPVLLAVFLL